MGEYALLTEVYGWSDSNKMKKKSKKNKKKQMIQPLSPNDMDRELLKDNEKTVFNKQNDPELKLKNMAVSPYINYNNDYQNIENYQNYQNYENENIMTPENQYYKPRNTDPRNNDSRNNDPRNNDPEYEEFLEYKRMKQYSGQSRDNFIEKIFKTNIFESNDQFNELLLYIFTGVFLLMIYDNMYKLGKNSY